jgi:hypothetical protein
MSDFSHYGGDAEENVEIKKLTAEVVRTPTYHLQCSAPAAALTYRKHIN